MLFLLIWVFPLPPAPVVVYIEQPEMVAQQYPVIEPENKSGVILPEGSFLPVIEPTEREGTIVPAQEQAIEPEFLLVRRNSDGSVVVRRNPLYKGPRH